jgi:hypothetical protein
MLGNRARAAASGLAVAAALALPIAGCGSGQEDTYKQEYSKAAAKFKKSVEEAGQKIPRAATLPDRIPALRSFKASIDKLAKDLDGLDPPDDVAKLNGQAVDGLHELSADLGKFEDAAREGDPGAAKRLAPKLQLDQAQLQETLDKIDQKVAG